MLVTSTDLWQRWRCWGTRRWAEGRAAPGWTSWAAPPHRWDSLHPSWPALSRSWSPSSAAAAARGKYRQTTTKGFHSKRFVCSVFNVRIHFWAPVWGVVTRHHCRWRYSCLTMLSVSTGALIKVYETCSLVLLLLIWHPGAKKQSFWALDSDFHWVLPDFLHPQSGRKHDVVMLNEKCENFLNTFCILIQCKCFGETVMSLNNG